MTGNLSIEQDGIIMPDIEDFAAVGIEAAKEAGELLLGKLNTCLNISHKGAINLVTEADRMSETLILNRLQHRFPDHSILTEESPASEG